MPQMTTDNSRFQALKSIVHSVVSSCLEQGVTFSQQPQQTVGEVIVTVKQVFPEYSEKCHPRPHCVRAQIKCVKNT